MCQSALTSGSAPGGELGLEPKTRRSNPGLWGKGRVDHELRAGVVVELKAGVTEGDDALGRVVHALASGGAAADVRAPPPSVNPRAPPPQPPQQVDESRVSGPEVV